MPRNQVFISYSRDDFRHVEDFLEILSPFLAVLPVVWSDRKIDPGQLWLPAIKDALASTKVAVMLVTPAFLASAFIKNVEYPEILRAQAKDGLIVFWIPVSSSGYKQTALKDFDAACDPKQPLDLMTVPKRRRAWVKVAERLMEAAGAIEQTDLPPRPRVVLLHRAGTQPDESILKLVADGLAGHGYEVFSHRENSLEVLNQLDSHLTRADVVVPLISPDSDSSEILAMHVEMARHKAERQNGRPQLVPLFIQHEARGHGVGHACKSLRRVTWRGTHDDGTIVQRLLAVVNGEPVEVETAADLPVAGVASIGSVAPVAPFRDPASAPTPVAAPSLVQGAAPGGEPYVLAVGGAVGHADPFYVRRETDERLRQALTANSSVIRIQGPRQMGKTSLLLRGLRQARDAGLSIVSMDFQAFNRSQFESQDTFYRALAETLAEDLRLDDVDLEAVWKPAKGANWNLDRFVRREILPRVQGRLVWAMDEVERLYQFDRSDDFFGLIRSWHNARASLNGAIFESLTVIICHATESHLFVPGIIRNPNASPFNVATSLFLSDFTLDHVADLNARFHAPLRTREQIEILYDLLGGQPFLIRRAFESLHAGASLDQLVANASKESGPFADHLHRILQVLAANAPLLDAVTAFLSCGEPLSPDEFFKLRAAGIVSGDAPKDAHLRRVYRDYLLRCLLAATARRSA